MHLEIEITETDNSAFRGDHSNGEPDAKAFTAEMARILRAVAGKILDGHTGGRCKDFNGNTVGNWSIGADAEFRLTQ